MEDIRDLHSMPHSPVNVPSHTTESAQTTTSWGEKLHSNREVPTSDRVRAKLYRDANFA